MVSTSRDAAGEARAYCRGHISEKDGEEAIRTGSGGREMKQIGMAERDDLERFLKKSIFLK